MSRDRSSLAQVASCARPNWRLMVFSGGGLICKVCCNPEGSPAATLKLCSVSPQRPQFQCA